MRSHLLRSVALATLTLLGASAGAQVRRQGAPDGALPPRESWQRVPDIVAALGEVQGRRVADIGAGQGLFTKALSARVGPAGRVYAVEIAAAARKALAAVRRALRPGGLLVVVDNAPTRDEWPRAEQASHHGLAPRFAVAELEAAGYEIAARDDAFIVRPFSQWMVVARRPAR